MHRKLSFQMFVRSWGKLPGDILDNDCKSTKSRFDILQKTRTFWVLKELFLKELSYMFLPYSCNQESLVCSIFSDILIPKQYFLFVLFFWFCNIMLVKIYFLTSWPSVIYYQGVQTLHSFAVNWYILDISFIVPREKRFLLERNL